MKVLEHIDVATALLKEARNQLVAAAKLIDEARKLRQKNPQAPNPKTFDGSLEEDICTWDHDLELMVVLLGDHRLHRSRALGVLR